MPFVVDVYVIFRADQGLPSPVRAAAGHEDAILLGFRRLNRSTTRTTMMVVDFLLDFADRMMGELRKRHPWVLFWVALAPWR
ncbi:MAG TPA: hypothetical protein VN408_06890 [Actinoplanes sp.]|nr:hypothetical protein [Actinoplanes sp.]